MRQPTNHEMGCYNVLQAAIYLKKAKFRSEGWGAPQTDVHQNQIRSQFYRPLKGFQSVGRFARDL